MRKNKTQKQFKKLFLLSIILAVLGLGFFAFSSQVSAAEYYIAPATATPAGNDSNIGTIGAPWATMNYAQTRMSAGDTLYVRQGRYTEHSIGWSLSGTVDEPINIKAYPGESPIFDITSSSSYGIHIGWTYAHVTKYITIDGLKWITTNTLRSVQAINIQNTDHITIRNSTFENIWCDQCGVIGASNFQACVDGYDNDGDGKTDAADPDCGVEDNSETPSGADNPRGLSQHTVLEFNTLKNITTMHSSGNKQDHAIYLGANTASDIIRYNYFENIIGSGIDYYHQKSIQGLDVYNNIFNHIDIGVIFSDRADDVHIYKNIFYDLKSDALDGQKAAIYITQGWGGCPTNVSVEDNIIESHYAADRGIRIGDGCESAVTINYNLLHLSAGTDICWKAVEGSCTNSWSYQDFVDNTDQGDNGQIGEPLFVNPSNPLGADGVLWTLDDGFRLDNDSPACGAGVNGGDIGAYECQSSFHSADVNNDTRVNIKDIQICIKAIVAPDSISETYLSNCKKVAPPETTVNIKDIQEIIKAIIGG